MLRAQSRVVLAALLAVGFAAAAVPRAVSAQNDDPEVAPESERPRPLHGYRRHHRNVKGAGEVALLWVPIGGGIWQTTYSERSGSGDDEVYDGNYQAFLHTGMRIAGYIVAGRRFRFGAFAEADLGPMAYSSDAGGESVSGHDEVALDSAFGLSPKWSFRTRRGVLVGPAVALGLEVHHADLRNSDVRPLLGIIGSVRFQLEFPAGDGVAARGLFAFGLNLSMVKGQALDSTDAITTVWLRLEPVLLLGVAFGD